MKDGIRWPVFGPLAFREAQRHIVAQGAKRIHEFGQRQSVEVALLCPLADQSLHRFNVGTTGRNESVNGMTNGLQSPSLFRGEGRFAAFRTFTASFLKPIKGLLEIHNESSRRVHLHKV